MNKFISPAIVSVAFDAEFATIGLRASTMIVATIRTAAKLAGVKIGDVSKEETRALALDIAARLTAKGCAPCNKHGAPYNKSDTASFISDCVRTAYGQTKAKTTAKPLPENDEDMPFDGVISAQVPRDKVDNSPVNPAPRGDGIRALDAMTATDAHKVADALALAAKLKVSKNADVLKLVAFVEEFFA